MAQGTVFMEIEDVASQFYKAGKKIGAIKNADSAQKALAKALDIISHPKTPVEGKKLVANAQEIVEGFVAGGEKEMQKRNIVIALKVHRDFIRDRLWETTEKARMLQNSLNGELKSGANLKNMESAQKAALKKLGFSDEIVRRYSYLLLGTVKNDWNETMGKLLPQYKQRIADELNAVFAKNRFKSIDEMRRVVSKEALENLLKSPDFSQLAQSVEASFSRAGFLKGKLEKAQAIMELIEEKGIGKAAAEVEKLAGGIRGAGAVAGMALIVAQGALFSMDYSIDKGKAVPKKINWDEK